MPFRQWGDLEHVPGTRLWKVTEEYIYVSPLAEQTVVVPVGFSTDLASVPRLLQGIYPKDGEWVEAAIVHDFLYAMQPYWCKRKTADRIFREAMIELGVPKHRAHILYLAVRVGGWTTWR